MGGMIVFLFVMVGVVTIGSSHNPTRSNFVDGQLTYSTTAAASSTNRVTGLAFKHRLYVPYGPDLTISPPQNGTNGEIWNGYGFGMGAVEHFAYDPYQRYVYAQSEFAPYVSIIDYSSIESNSGQPSVTSYSLDLTSYDSDIRDIAVCNDYLMIVATDANVILQYTTVQRSAPTTPTLVREISAGNQPDNIRFNTDCTILAVANENDGSSTAVGTIHLVSNLNENEPTVRTVALDTFGDDYLLGRNVHMPLTLNALEYWDEYSSIANDVDWSTIRADYSPNLFLQPEHIQFSPDSKTLLVNLQTNSALARIDIVSATLVAIDGYGLKPWTTGDGIDIVDDDGCNVSVTHPLLYSVPAPDVIASVDIDGELYVLTANEGSDFEYGDSYSEKIDAKELFNGIEFGPQGFVVNETIFNTTNSTFGLSANFNADCETNQLEWCADGLEITLGSSAVDYSNASAPILNRIVAFGGRGMSIFKVPLATADASERIELIWDSKSDFEKLGCAKFPWAHNGVQDESFAPVDGAYYQLSDSDEKEALDAANDPGFDGTDDAGDGQPGARPIRETIDEKATSDGLAPESVVVAIACDRLVAVSCGENNGNCYMYDITTITAPAFIDVINLSPASETQSPGVAYNARTLGDIDAETLRFVPANESPSGFSGIMFGGAHSGTLSFYEFVCMESVDPVEETLYVGTDTDVEGDDSTIIPIAAPAGGTSIDNESDSLSGGAIAGIVIGTMFGLGAILFLLQSFRNKEPARATNVVDTTNPEQDMS